MEKTIMTHIHAVIFDVDGTLVDSNDAQARSWVDALKELGYSVTYEKVRPLIGMGGDKVLPETIGVQKDSEKGKQISKRRSEIFKEKYLPNVKPFPDTQKLLDRMRKQGLKLAIATSAQPDELRPLLQIVGAADLIEEKTSARDVKSSKPDPDVMQVALKRVGYPPNEVVMIGDAPYDIEAARKAGVGTIAFRCGGLGGPELARSNAIYNAPADLVGHYDRCPVALLTLQVLS